MSNGTKVVKRDGKTELLDLNKLHVMVEQRVKTWQESLLLS